MGLSQYRIRSARVLLLVSIAATAVIAIVAHVLLRTRHDPLAYTGPLLIGDHLFDILVVIFLLWICAGLGRLVLRRVRLNQERPFEELLFAIGLGAAALATVLLFAGLIGLLRPYAVIGTVLLLAGLSARQMADVLKLIGRGAARLRARAGDSAIWATAAAITGLAVVAMFVQASAPPADWDALMYHLQVPRQFLEEGRIYVPPDNLHVAFVGMIHMLSLPLLAVKSAAGPALLSTFFALILGLATFSLAERFFDRVTASVAMGTLWATTSLLLVAITPRIDVTLALFLLLALYALLLAEESENGRTYLYLAAVLFGVSLGIKLHAGAFIVASGPLVLWVALKRRSARSALADLTVMGGLILAAAAPWFLKNWLLVQAPLYPLLSGDILDPWLVSFLGNAVPAGVDPHTFQMLAQARLPFDLVDLFVAPGRLTVEAEGAHYHMSWVFLLLVFWPLFRRRQTLNWLIVTALAYLVIIIVPFGYTNLRYLIPVIAPLTIAASYILVELSRQVRPARAGRAVVIAVMIALLYPSVRTMYVWFRKAPVLGHFVGSTSAGAYLKAGYPYYWGLVETVNEHVPREGKVLLLFEARGYYFEPEVIQDNSLTNWPLAAARLDESSGCLEGTGITHVLVSNAAVGYYVNRGTDPELFRAASFPPFARRCLQGVYDGRGFDLYGVKETRAADPSRGTLKTEGRPG